MWNHPSENRLSYAALPLPENRPRPSRRHLLTALIAVGLLMGNAAAGRILLDAPSFGAPVPADLAARRGDGEAERYVLARFPGPVTRRQLEGLRSVGRVYTYLPHHAFLLKVAAVDGAAARLEALGAGWVGPYHPAYKISRDAAAADTAEGVLAGRHQVMLLIYPDADLESVKRRVSALLAGGPGPGAIVGWREGEFFSRLRLLLSPSDVATLREDLARLPEVFWIALEPRRVLLNDTTIWVGQSGLAGGQGTPVFDRGIYGEGQVIGVLDTGIDAGMCYFRDPVRGLPPRNECNGGTVIDPLQRKVLAVDFLWSSECAGGISDSEWDTHDHGTHVAGTAAGDDLATLLLHDPGDGMAPGAKLVIQDCGLQFNNCADCPGIGCPVVDLNPVFQQAYDQGARIHTNSWGDQENSSIQNNYTTASQDADEFMWNHKDFLLLFAAGNQGPGTATVGSPSTAKSVLSVGSTLRGTGAGTLSSFSSCGPTDDGRIKPEITIPGSSIQSANNDGSVATANCNLRSMSGTSMASPAAAGLAALARQYYADGWHPTGAPEAADAFEPSAALIRATLVNSAEAMSGVSAPIPSDCQGWGRLNLDNALYFGGAGERRLWARDDAAGFPAGSSAAEHRFTFDLDAASSPFKVTLAWTDFPSTPAALVHLNNDLDLEVSGPGGTFLGNAFAGGESTPGGAPDRLNTLEQVLLTNPAPGRYTVTVRSFNVPDGPQPYALVVAGGVTTELFADGFESGDLSAWSAAVGP